MKEIKFYNGGIANFTTLKKNENYFYVRYNKLKR